MINVSPNMVVDTEAPNVKKAQDGVLEFLLSTTRSIAPCATRAASARCKTERWRMAPANRASSKRSATSKSRSHQ